MKEIQEILKKIESLEPNEKAILATVVDVQGSSYRLPGAKMLILENGETFGTVSGGCLEADVLERAKNVLETGEPQVFIYDTTNDQDSVFSLNMGCRGVIRILLEVVGSKMWHLGLHHYKLFSEEYLATFIDAGGKYPICTRSSFDIHGQGSSEIDEEDYKILQKEIYDHWENKLSYTKNFEFGEIFIEYLAPPIKLILFGAGADVVPVTDFAKKIGWNVTVIDHREKVATKERFPNADKIFISRPEEISNKLNFEENSVYLSMTHNYEHDKKILKTLLKSEATYIGSLGPKRRSENMLKEFDDEGLEFSDDELSKLYSPVGLDIGADTPESIALAIIAEIQAVIKKRNGGFLKHRKGSIYGRN